MKQLKVFFLALAIISCQRKPSLNCPYTINARLARLPAVVQINSSVPAEYYPCMYNAIATWNKFADLFVVGQSEIIQIDWYTTRPNDMTPNMEAVTSTAWKDGIIVSAHIKFNAQNFNFSDDIPVGGQTDCESVAIHELGHSLGLLHQPDYNSVMYASLSPGQVRRTLDSPEEQALECLYAE